MCSIPLEVSALIVRAVAFVVSLGFLPVVLAPISFRFALAISLVMFAIPFVAADSLFCLFTDYKAVNVLLENLSWQIILAEITIGAFLAIAVSGVGYAAQLFSSWSARLISAHLASPVFSDEVFFSSNTKVLRGFALLLAVFLFLSFLPFAQFVLPLIRSLAELPYLQSAEHLAEQGLAALVSNVFMSVLSSSFKLALVLALPLLIASLIADLMAIVVNRYLPKMVNTVGLSSVKIPLLVLFLSLTIYPLSASIESYLRNQVVPTSQEVLSSPEVKSNG